MPCYSDPEDYKSRETEALNDLLHFIDEVSVRHIPDFNETHSKFEDFKDKVKAIDEFTQRLCFILSKENPSKYTNKLQDWWKKHQEWDKQRIENEQKTSRNNSNTGDGTSIYNSL